MIAATAGIPRGAPLGVLQDLHFSVRVDRPGTRIVDFHTVGGNYPRSSGIPTAEGSRKKTAIITQRHYLSDAIFTVACTGPDNAVNMASSALQRPHWQPYLGRRSCPPEQPMVLGIFADAEAELTKVPLPQRVPDGHNTVTVDIIRTATVSQNDTWTTIFDDCDTFPAGDRAYRPRPVTRTAYELPATLCRATPDRYQLSLIEYMKGTQQ